MINKNFNVKMSVKSPLMESIKLTKEFGTNFHIDLQKIIAEVARLKPAVSDVTGRFIKIII